MNTPTTIEAKAKELVDKFRNELSWIEKDHKVDLWREARQCAIICVDEIMLYYPVANDDENSQRFHEYWLSVKEQILLL